MKDIQSISELQWPQDRFRIALLNLSELQTWYAYQDPRSMIFTGQNEEFRRFWKLYFLYPTRFYRFILKIKLKTFAILKLVKLLPLE